MGQVTGGELVVRALLAAGAPRAFGLHGAHIDSLFQAFRDHGAPVIDTRHEAAAGHAAEGYARTSGALGVALLTAGGGFTNGLTSIANAWLDRTPVLYLAGSGPLQQDETNTLQAGIDQVAMAAPVTKWAHRVLRTDHLPRLVAQAVRIAMAAPRGPVLLDIPWDILGGQLEADEADALLAGLSYAPGAAAPAAQDVSEIIDLLAQSRRPVIVVGSEASRSRAAATLEALALSTRTPVFADYEGLNLLAPLPAALNGGLVQGLYGLAADGMQPDCVLMLGVRFGLNTAHGSGILIPRQARIVQIDPDAREIGRLQPVAKGAVCDVGQATTALAEAAGQRSWPGRDDWLAAIGAHVERRRVRVEASLERTQRLHPFTASAIVAEHIGRDTVVVADGALTYHWLSEVISAARPAGFLCHGFFGSMGVGFGTAIGAQTAALEKRRRTLLVTGDGSVGYSLAEFDTAVRHGLPLIVVVMNNRSWGATLHFQAMVGGDNSITNTRLENGSYADAARALGADGYQVTDAEGLRTALAAAFASQRPACIEVLVALEPVPPEENVLMGQDPFPEAAAHG